MGRKPKAKRIGRPPVGTPYRQFTLAIPEDALAQVRLMASLQGQTLSEALRELIGIGLEVKSARSQLDRTGPS